MIIIVIGAIYFLSKLNTKYEDSESDNIVSTPMDSLYINDCKRIIDYKQGVCPLGKKKMILSTAAKNYYKAKELLASLSIDKEHTDLIVAFEV